MLRKLFSIIIPCYNPNKTIEGTLDSIMEQGELSDVEVIICDDRSDDGFMSLVEPYREKIDIRYFRTREGEPKGPANARNTGIVNAVGEWIIFLDSDDRISQGALSFLREKIESGAEYMIWCPFRHNYKDVYPNSLLALQGKCFQASFLNENGIRFNSELYTEEDYDFISKVRYELKAQDKEYVRDTFTICEHIDNEDSMVHSIKNYFHASYKDFAIGYSEPSILYGRKYPLQREYFLRESIYAFFMLYYRFRHIKTETEDYSRFKKILDIRLKNVLDAYNISSRDILPFIADQNFNRRTMEHSCCDLGIEGMELITEDEFLNDFKDIDKSPLFSIVIPCFNCRNTIGGVLDSILRQEERDFEVLICDDRSEDRFMDVVNAYNDRLYIRYFRTEEGTMHCPSNPRQMGMDNAKGDWIVFIDSDDTFSDTALKDYKVCIDDGAQNFIWGGFSKGDSLYCNSRIALHGKAFNLNFLRGYNIRFNEHIFMEEDYDFVQKVLFTIEGENLLYYIWKKNFYNYTVESESSSMSSVGSKYFENTYESFLQSRFEPLFTAYIAYPHKREHFGELIIYSIYLCYFKYHYFLERNGNDFMNTVITKTRRYITRALGLIGENADSILEHINEEKFEWARNEIIIDSDINNIDIKVGFNIFLKNILLML